MTVMNTRHPDGRTPRRHIRTAALVGLTALSLLPLTACGNGAAADDGRVDVLLGDGDHFGRHRRRRFGRLRGDVARDGSHLRGGKVRPEDFEPLSESPFVRVTRGGVREARGDGELFKQEGSSLAHKLLRP